MLFSNLHSFHFAKTLQNATALPGHVYRKINNRRSINNEARTAAVNNSHRQTQRPVRMKKAGQVEPVIEANSSPFPELREPLTIEGSAIRKKQAPTPPVIRDIVETKPKAKPEFTPISQSTREQKPSTTQQGKQPVKTRPTEGSHNNITALPNTTTSPVNISQSTNAPLPIKRNVWKPGHGAIEKVDKLTGEIVHLAEEYIDNEKIVAIR